ncbi:DUF3014 domain-containing protein [Azohydromonas aeria]|uniref:DUF3014 domain-containing protein n=1 Tax=Azohydromonas aeria TaxID=2590212 RepID=UPI0012F7D744|nr:DUF3014 domain-containing protein [Azohydromonas aeria]
MSITGRAAFLGAVATVVAVVALRWRSQEEVPIPVPVQPDATTVSAAPPAPASGIEAGAAAASAAAASQPEPQARIEVPAAAAPLGSQEDVVAALVDLLGRKAVLTFLQTDDFARRLVATVDNLGRTHAPARLWPFNPTGGRFTVQAHEGRSIIAPDNALRYTPFVLLAETVSVERAVDLYVRMYPLLQQSWVDLGYPKGYFNDRLLQVIDLLLATPEVEHPVPVQLTEVKGPIPSEQPWVRYEFADPALEALSAGQKLLLRTGAVNQRRLKGKLQELRNELVKRAAER